MSTRRYLFAEDDTICLVSSKKFPLNEDFKCEIIKKSSGNIVGAVKLKLIKRNEYSINIKIHDKQQNKGFGTRAIRLVSRYCFTNLGADSLWYKCNIKNYSAMAFAKKFGFFFYHLEGDEAQFKLRLLRR